MLDVSMVLVHHKNKHDDDDDDKEDTWDELVTVYWPHFM
jgi:hypothetical protein